MCGLILSFDPKITTHKMSKAMSFMSHRGTQKPIISEYDNFKVAHIRLPIINLEGGEQPFIETNYSTWLVGEVFNYKEINPHAETDTEVMHDCLRGGFQDLHKLDGMWSVVHRYGNSAIAFTDYLSQKPLYYSEKYKFVASEPDAFKIFELTPDEIYLSNCVKWGYDPTGRTPWKEVKQLPAGHYIDKNMDPKPYWDWSKIEVPVDLYETFEEAVRNRLVCDRPMAMLLSGGLDSSLTFKVALEMGAKLKVFHVDNDESESFEKVIGDHKYEKLVTETPSLKDALKAMQGPCDAGSLLPQLALSDAVKSKRYNVTLSGDGADELFGGYRRAKEYDSQHSDTFVELPYWHLPRLDRVMMRNTIEHRTPFLAPKMIAYALSLPWEKRTEKQELKRIAKDFLPEEIIYQPKKPLKSFDFGIEHRIELLNEWRKNYV